METDLRARPDRHAQSPRVLARAWLPAPLPTFSCDGEESSGDGIGGCFCSLMSQEDVCFASKCCKQPGCWNTSSEFNLVALRGCGEGKLWLLTRQYDRALEISVQLESSKMCSEC